MKPYSILSGLLLLMLVVSAGAAATGQGWKFRSDLSNSGVYDDGGTRPDGTLLWNFSTGHTVRSSPAVVDGIVYFGSNDGNLTALDASTGDLIWNSAGGIGIQSSPAVVGGIVYAGCWDGNISAFDASDGSLLWNYTTGDAVISSPSVAEGTLYVGSFDGNLYALDSTDGDLVWVFPTAGPRITSSPAVLAGVVYVGSEDTTFYALDEDTGTLIWNYTTGGQIHSSPSVTEGAVYFGSDDGSLYALNRSSGTPLWSFSCGDKVRSSPAVADGVVYVGSYDESVYALDAETGALLWSCRVGDQVFSSPAVANGVVYVGTLGFDGSFYALEAETGAILWDYSMGEWFVHSSPAVSGGMVYVGCDDGSLYAFGSLPDNPPESITTLHTTMIQEDSVTWKWTDPLPAGFSHIMVYLDGVFQENVTKGKETWTPTGLASSTEYTVGTRTVGTSGLVNETWVNHTAVTPSGTQATAWKFRSDSSNSGVYDDGGIRPGNELLWKYMTESYYGSTPAIVDGVVYACGIYDTNAIDALTGRLLWNSPSGGGTSSPTVADNVVYVGSSDSNVYALDASTGAVLWNFTTGSVVYSSPALSNGIVYAGSWDDNLYALDMATGTPLWNFTTGGDVRSSPAVAYGIVYIGSTDHKVYALDANTGALIWNYTTGGELTYSSPAVSNGIVYIQSSDSTLSALDAASGELLWTLPFGGLTYSWYQDFCPAVAYGMVYIRSGDATISAIDAITADYIWNYTTSGPVIKSPSIANGVVYIGNDGGIVSALDAATGDLLWEHVTDETRYGFSSPAIANGVVYIQGMDTGYLYALATLPDDPPESVSDLHATAMNGAEITWAWSDPGTFGFSHVMVYQDGVFQDNGTAGKETWTATGLAPSTAYTIGIRTVGVNGLVNGTMVTNTATTGTLSISHLDPAGVVEDDPAFTLTVYGTGFTPACTIHWNGGEQATQYLQPDRISMDVPAEYVAHSRRVKITVHDPVSGESSNAVILPVTDNPATATGRKFRSDLTNTGVYDDGGRRPVPTLLWTYKTGASVSSSPSVVDGVVYVGSQDRNLYALDAASGALLWKYNTMERNDYVSSSPAVANGVVYIGGLKTKIHAVDAYSGELLWKYKLPIRTTVRSGISSSAAVADGIIYIGNMDGDLYAFREETGDLLWNFTALAQENRDNEIFSSPAVADSGVFIVDLNGKVYALEPTTGNLLWTVNVGNRASASSPSVGEGILYIGGDQSTLWALDVNTGAALWNFTAGGRLITSSPALADGIVYYGSYDNNTYALDASTGALLWNFTTGGSISSSPAVAGGVVYIGSSDTNIYALDASTGALLWNFTTGRGVSSSPAVAHGIVYFGSGDGNVYAIGSLPIDPPLADFSANVTSGDAPLDVLFTDTSSGVVTTRFWDFGDGTTAWANGTVTVSHTYLFPGTFTVSLTAGNQDGEDTLTRTGYIQVSPSGLPPRTRFTAAPLAGYVPLAVQFTDRSLGVPTAWSWDFGDGNRSSEQNPGHTYAATGRYTITLTTANSGGSSSYSSSVWVREAVVIPTLTPRPTISPEPGRAPVAMFFASKSFGLAPTTVQFTDRSLGGPTAWSWDFGDGNTSVLRNPANTFAVAGTYPVSLTVENTYGESTTVRRVYVR